MNVCAVCEEKQCFFFILVFLFFDRTETTLVVQLVRQVFIRDFRQRALHFGCEESSRHIVGREKRARSSNRANAGNSRSNIGTKHASEKCERVALAFHFEKRIR